MFWVIFVYALFASVFTTAKEALEYASPFFLVGSRMFVAGLILLSYQYFFDRKHFKLKASNLKPLFLMALFTIYLTNVLEFWGLKYLTSFKTCFIYSLSPFLSVLLSYLMLGEVLTKKKWAGLILGFLGFLPIMMSSTAQEEMTGQFWIFSWAELAVVMAVFCSVYGWILLKQMVTDEEGCSPVMANGVSMLLGGIFALIQSRVSEPWDPLPITNFLSFAIYASILIVISNLIAYNLYGYLLKRYSATFMSFAGLTTPLFTALFGWIFLGEVVSWPFYLSFAIVFSGLLLFNQEELQHAFP